MIGAPQRKSGRIHWLMLMASFMMSVLLWFVVFAQNNLTSYATIEVRPVGFDEGRYFMRTMPRSIRVVAMGSRPQMDAYTADNVFAEVDLSRPIVGSHSYPIQLVPESFRGLVQDAPRTVQITIEELTSKPVEVTLETSGSLADPNFALERLSGDIDRVSVRGPKSEVDQIVKVRGVLDLNGVSQSRAEPFEVELVALTADNRTMEYVTVTPRTVTVTPALIPAPVEKRAFVKAEFQGEPAAGYEVVEYIISPREVALLGTSRAVAAVSQVSTAPISIDGLVGNRTFEVALIPPEGIRIRPTTVRVEVRVQPKALPETTPPPTSAGTGGEPTTSTLGTTAGIGGATGN